jgi:hypothetical protein
VGVASGNQGLPQNWIAETTGNDAQKVVVEVVPVVVVVEGFRSIWALLLALVETSEQKAGSGTSGCELPRKLSVLMDGTRKSYQEDLILRN